MTVPLRSELTDAHIPSVLMRRMAEKRIQFQDVLDNTEDSGRPQRDSGEEKPNPQITLEDIFHKADTSKDELLSTKELSDWINKKTQEHIHQAIIENYSLFTKIDVRPRNGMISWDEYHAYFLTNNGLSSEYVKEHSERHKELDRRMKEAIMRDKAAWSEAARTDPENLTLDEFLAFRHPESSHTTILSLVDELFDKFDRDGDEILTEDEFSTLPTDGDDKGVEVVLTQGESDRRTEFREVIDKNKDGKANRQELLMYIDPKNPRHAREEAETLVLLADSDHDGKLSLMEVFNKMDLFLGSKMVDTARSFHDEF